MIDLTGYRKTPARLLKRWFSGGDHHSRYLRVYQHVDGSYHYLDNTWPANERLVWITNAKAIAEIEKAMLEPRFVAIPLRSFHALSNEDLVDVWSGLLGVALTRDLEPVAYLCDTDQARESWQICDGDLLEFRRNPSSFVDRLGDVDAIRLDHHLKLGSILLVAPRHADALLIPEFQEICNDGL